MGYSNPGTAFVLLSLILSLIVVIPYWHTLPAFSPKLIQPRILSPHFSLILRDSTMK